MKSVVVERLSDTDEDTIIEIFKEKSGSSDPNLVVPNGDDAAAWICRDDHVEVASTDSLVLGIHFDPDWTTWREVGRKLVAVNLSDLASMGARPRHILLSFHFPREFEVKSAKELAQGIFELCKEFEISIAGGNITRTPRDIVLGATVVGAAGQRGREVAGSRDQI